MKNIVKRFGRTHAHLPSLTLAQYLEFLQGVPTPTNQQRDNFVEFVPYAHSWYKHLPLGLPGTPFHFYIDKYAGWDHRICGYARAGNFRRSN